MRITKNRFLQGFAAVVFLLAIVRLIFPSIAKPVSERGGDADTSISRKDTLVAKVTEGDGQARQENQTMAAPGASQDTVHRDSMFMASRFFKADGSLVKNRIYSVPRFSDAFPDQNDVQLTAAEKWGVKPVKDRLEAEIRKSELVYVGSNPYFYVDRLHSSIPYLVPKASVLLQDIGRTFFDSLQIKGIPLHKIIITSVMRSKADVAKLRGHNGNATQNSCHLYGTTFDVCYNRYKTVEDPNGQKRRPVRNDTLKWVLSEVLNDMRKSNRCYVKYEVNQGCLHITVK